MCIIYKIIYKKSSILYKYYKYQQKYEKSPSHRIFACPKAISLSKTILLPFVNCKFCHMETVLLFFNVKGPIEQDRKKYVVNS